MGDRVWIIFLGLLLPILSFGQNRTIILSDFDGVFVEDRVLVNSRGKVSVEGAFKTPVILFRQELRGHSIQDVPTGLEEIQVDWHTFMKIQRRDLLAKGPRQLGNQIDSFKTINGESFYPGEYEIRLPQTYKYYFESFEKGKNYLLDEFKLAEKRAKARGVSWKGRHWKTIEKILSTAETAKNFGIITARGHSKKEWKEFFRYLKKKKYIKFEPNYDLIHGVTRPDEYDLYGMEIHGEVAMRKAKLVRELCQIGLSREEIDPGDLRISPKGKDHPKEAVHSVVVIDDSIDMIEALHKELATVVTGQDARVKIAIIDVSLPGDEFLPKARGITGQISRQKRPRYSIITPNGTYRLAEDIEILGESSELPSKLRRVKGLKNPFFENDYCGGCNPCGRVHAL